MAQCPKCGNPIRKDAKTKVRSCRRHGPILTMRQMIERENPCLVENSATTKPPSSTGLDILKLLGLPITAE